MATSKKITTTLFFLIVLIAAQAQNKSFDWGVGIHGSIYSYSAMIEHKISSPYQYNRGLQVSVSRYINNNFDVDLNVGRTTTNYYTGRYNGELIYQPTKLYDGAISLKYKLDNGYIIKHENYNVSPFLKAGIGTNYVGYMGKLDVSVPAGFGINIGMGKYASFVYETSIRHNVLAGNTYATHSVGLEASLGKASKSRLTATKAREYERKLARIEKQKEEREKTKLANAIKREEREALRQVTASLNEETEEELPMPVLAAEEEAVVEVPAIEESFAKESVDTKLNDKAEDELFSAAPKPIFEEKKEIANSILPTLDTLAKEEIVPSKPIIEEKPVKANEDYCLASATTLTQLGKDVSFDVNSYKIRSRMHSALSQIVATMNECEATQFAVIAHTDSDGDADSNNRLAKKRAEAVKEYLVAQGIDAARLTTLAYGEYMADGETTSADKAANRRISFKVNRTSF
jgi:outer membrane protein OmpA-like peptidoglycan-associated protein